MAAAVGGSSAVEPLLTLGPGGEYVRTFVAAPSADGLCDEIEEVVRTERKPRGSSEGSCGVEAGGEGVQRAAATHAELLRQQWAEHATRHGELSAAHHLLVRQAGPAAASMGLLRVLSRGVGAAAEPVKKQETAPSRCVMAAAALLQVGKSASARVVSRRRARNATRQPTLFAR